MERQTIYTSRLFNDVIYVLMDQIILSSAGESEENVLYHDALLNIRNNPGQIDEIADWVSIHKEYLPRPLEEGMSDELYSMVVDGILLIYAGYYDNTNIDIDNLAADYEKGYFNY